MVDSPEDAIKTFYTSGIDILALNNYIITKEKWEKLSQIILLNILNHNNYLTGTFINVDGGMINGGIFEPWIKIYLLKKNLKRVST